MKKSLSTYLDLCTQFYDITKPLPPENDYLFYRSYVQKADGPILEPMCGTGRFLLPLLAEGFNVDGFDASEHMLKTLKQKAEAKGLHPNVWLGFTEDLNTKTKYSLIFIPTGSFGLISDLSSAQNTLKIFYDHLDDNGILLFEAETPHPTPSSGEKQIRVCNTSDGNEIRLSTLASFKDNLLNIKGEYSLIAQGRVINTENEEYRIRHYNSADMLEMLKNAGFEEIRMIKAFVLDAEADAKDDVTVYECRKHLQST